MFQVSNLQVTAGDGTADGKRSLLAVGKTSSEPCSVVLNWPALLKVNDNFEGEVVAGVSSKASSDQTSGPKEKKLVYDFYGE